MYIVQHNDGRVFNLQHTGEAKFWSWLSFEFIVCNVYRNGSMQLLSPYDFS